jgi:hypothetical protein
MLRRNILYPDMMEEFGLRYLLLRGIDCGVYPASIRIFIGF